VASGIGAAAVLACAALLSGPLAHVLSTPASSSSTGYDVERMVLLYATLPRLVMALLCGGALSAAGAILQQALRNPLASATTLGVDAGARLALAVATLFLGDLAGVSRDLIALAGSVCSTAIVFGLVSRRDFSAIAIVLAGLIVSLYCGAFAAIFTLVENRYLESLFIWGNGSLSQQSWEPCKALLLRLALSTAPVLLLLRPLTLLDLGDEAGRSLGLSVTRVRALAIGIAVLLSAFVTSSVGVIGFIGLAGPLLARLAGARTFAARFVWSTVIGAFLLLLTDAALQILANGHAQFLPTGAVTAVFGSPLLLLLLPRLKATNPPPSLRSVPMPGAASSARLRIAVMPVAVLLATLALFLGRGASGSWHLLDAALWPEVMPWRAPRFFAAAASGGTLAASGFILQRLTGNAMASPEVLGVSAGSVLATALSLFAIASFPLVLQGVAATMGGLAALAMVLALSRRSGFAPERVLLAGVALNALVDAIVGVLTAAGDPRALMLLAWMSGSTSGTTASQALFSVFACFALVLLAALTSRWLAAFTLGGAQARAIGVPVSLARLALLVLAAAMAAAATPVIGPVTFVGLMAPHIAHMAGVRRTLPTLMTSVVVGGTLMAVADFAARTVAFPLQLPTGLVAALIGGPFLMFLLFRLGRVT
jgi:iron complex transport system permease protein